MINTLLLSISFSNKLSFVLLKKAISSKFELIYPLVAHMMLTRWESSERPSFILFKSLKFSLHCLVPLGNNNSLWKKSGPNMRKNDIDESMMRWREFSISKNIEEWIRMRGRVRSGGIVVEILEIWGRWSHMDRMRMRWWRKCGSFGRRRNKARAMRW